MSLIHLPTPPKVATLRKLWDEWQLIVYASILGGLTAFAAIGFKYTLDFAAEEGLHLTAGWPLFLLPVLPMIGALLCAAIVIKFAPEARGHGVPEVMDAVYRKGGKIRGRVALVKAVSSIMTIGSGGSAGAEGPIVQVGSAIGSAIGQRLHLDKDQVRTLLGCGAAAGIASVFNAPIAAAFFAMEILLRDFTQKTFTPIIVASVLSTATTQAVLGKNEAIFDVSFVAKHDLSTYNFKIHELPNYLVLGLVCAAVAVAFVKLLYKTEDIYDRLAIPRILKPVTGALLLGILGVLYLTATPATERGEIPNFFGNGYATIERLLEPNHYTQPSPDTAPPIQAAPPAADEHTPTHDHTLAPEQTSAHSNENITIPGSFWVLGLLVLCKALATCLTLGSGGSGGVFAPSLFLGATAGATFGLALEALGLIPDGGSPAAYALVGMAAVVAATTHAPLTAILMLFELTRDVYVLLPIMIAAVIATVIAKILLTDSIYSLKLRRRGIITGSTVDHTLLQKLTARDVQLLPHVPIRPSDPLSKVLALRDAYQVIDFVAIDSLNRFAGLVTAQDLHTALIEREAIPYLLVAELIREDLPTIDPDEPLGSVLEKFSATDVSSLAVIDKSDPATPKAIGMLTRDRLMLRYQRALDNA